MMHIRTSKPQILDLRFARYAKYDDYYTPIGKK